MQPAASIMSTNNYAQQSDDYVDTFIEKINRSKLTLPQTGYVANTSEKEVGARLQELYQRPVIQKDTEFKKKWSFFALIDVPNKLVEKASVWIKNGQIHSEKYNLRTPDFFSNMFAKFGKCFMDIKSFEKIADVPQSNEYSETEIHDIPIDTVEMMDEQRENDSDNDEDYLKYIPLDLFPGLRAEDESSEESVDDVESASDDDEELSVTPAEPSYMTLRPNSHNPVGKRVYYRPELVSVRRYFPPAERLPLHCK